MKAYVIDAETNIKNRGEGAVGTMLASPYCPDNGIVLFADKELGHLTTLYSGGSAVPECLLDAREQKILLIGHNISFDLKYLKKTWPVSWRNVINNIYIWDTQQVAYLLSAQQHTYPSLNDLAAEIGEELKDEKIKEYWEAGVDTEDIPKDELASYLAHDIHLTERVFRYQYEIVSNLPALFNLVRVKMDDILATTAMEDAGMNFSLSKADYFIRQNEVKLSIHMIQASACVKDLFDRRFWFNPMSNDHVSIAMFGGKYTITEDQPVVDEHGNYVVYKTGKRKGEVKTKKVEVELTSEGMGLTPQADWETKKQGIYSVSDEVLNNFRSLDFANNILQIRSIVKENETYYRGYSKLVWPNGLIHPNINHCSTKTGRQSCTKPNLQNVTREE